jgi:DNA-binding transcriptional LysR family regulator
MLKDEPLIVVAQRINPQFYDKLMMAFARGTLVPRVIQEANSGIVLSLVSVGMGVGVVSSAMRSRAPRDVVLRAVDDLTLSTYLDLTWRRDNGSPVLQRFVSSVMALVREQDGPYSRPQEARGRIRRQGVR